MTDSLHTHFSRAMQRFAPFEASPHLAVATSGGADSMALLLLCKEWAAEQGAQLTALTVDHGLRAESTHEAQQVKEWAATHGITHETLHVAALDHSRNVEAQARDARYAAIDAWCNTHNVLHVLLGHHLDDQAETVLMRLGRGSGVDGLAGMAAIGWHHNRRILRPLLSIRKQQLVAFLKARNQPWLEDSSNLDARFTRNKLRQLLPALEETGIYAERLADTATRMGLARQSLASATADALAHSATVWPEGYATFSGTALPAQNEEIGLRFLANLLQTIAGQPYRGRLSKLRNLYAEIVAGLDVTRSLGGCLIMPKDEVIWIVREPAAIQKRQPINTDRGVWDARWQWACPPPHSVPVHIGALGEEGWREVREECNSPAPKEALVALPAFWHLDELIAVPHISWQKNDANLTASACFSPAKSLADAPFYCMYEGQK